MRDGDNIRACEELEPDMMGFICWKQSSRCVSTTPSYMPCCERVGVFVDPTIEEIIEKTEQLGLNRIQLHGYESREFCRLVHQETGLPITKAISVKDSLDLSRWHEYAYETSVDLFLFDTKCHCVGGSGNQFDWNILSAYNGNKPFILAGGIGPEDYNRLKGFRHPQMIGIDLNSRFETEPGLKDVERLKSFLNNIR